MLFVCLPVCTHRLGECEGDMVRLDDVEEEALLDWGPGMEGLK